MPHQKTKEERMGILGKKLLLHKAHTIWFLNEPEEYTTILADELSENAVIVNDLSAASDFVVLFVKNSAELRQWADPGLKPALNGGIVWVSYPKKSSKVDSDLSRDILVSLLNELGFQGVSLISLDETWSAMRVKPL